MTVPLTKRMIDIARRTLVVHFAIGVIGFAGCGVASDGIDNHRLRLVEHGRLRLPDSLEVHGASGSLSHGLITWSPSRAGLLHFVQGRARAFGDQEIGSPVSVRIQGTPPDAQIHVIDARTRAIVVVTMAGDKTNSRPLPANWEIEAAAPHGEGWLVGIRTGTGDYELHSVTQDGTLARVWSRPVVRDAPYVDGFPMIVASGEALFLLERYPPLRWYRLGTHLRGTDLVESQPLLDSVLNNSADSWVLAGGLHLDGYLVLTLAWLSSDRRALLLMSVDGGLRRLLELDVPMALFGHAEGGRVLGARFAGTREIVEYEYEWEPEREGGG